jgi:predicted transcriptional regulator
MDKFLMVIKSIDWVFAGIILIGGRYWGGKYFRLSKISALNFLGFATAFGILWLVIKYYTVGIAKSEIGNLFITYLVTTSFYEVFAKYLFEQIEKALPWFKKDEKESETVITLKGGNAIKDIQEVKPEDKKP